jgi:hypothetical protein
MILKNKIDKLLRDISSDLQLGRMSTKEAIEETEYLNQTTMQITKAYNVQIWVGLQETYDEEKLHTIDEVENICQEFVNDVKDCVTVTPTKFKYVNGGENGAVIGWISYPRFPRKRKEIRKRALFLAEKLMNELNQYRVTVTTPFKSYMLENKNVEQ